MGPQDFLAFGFGPLVLLIAYIAAYGAGAAWSGLLKRVIKYLLLMASLMGILGFLQVADVPGARQFASSLTGNKTIVDIPDWKVPRAIGIFHAWHAYASYMALCLIISVAFLAYGVSLFRSRWILPACSLCISMGLISSMTFGMIGLGAAGAGYLLLKNRKFQAFFLGCVLVVIGVGASSITGILSERLSRQETVTTEYSFLPQTVAFRVVVWTRDYLPLISDNPWIGYGPIRESDRVFAYVESMYLLVLVTTGIVGFIAFLILLANMVIGLSRRIRETSAESNAVVFVSGRAILVFLIGLVGMMLIHPYLNDAGSSELLVVLVGIMMGAEFLPDRPSSIRSGGTDSVEIPDVSRTRN
ncbi:O-antigen ligase family protein [Rhodococcus artemisiae]|uniref:O-antigen ligase family protein n=1 Tax=Rhodococcus artemisiae TaxID=714159 RepID=A0ABU7LFS1_9NOCA|nr:O-antigen ligase family protein [Rhodococcus artemisiae]MEE2060390.1 O-antigen ligase family protein [Rhodococcus artemisiae]